MPPDRPGFILRLWLICGLLVCVAPGLAAAAETMKIGVLAFRGEQDAIERWTPTARYLSESIPGHDFEILALTLDGMYRHVEQDRLDFILTNTGNYVVLENAFGISRLATLKVRHLGSDFTQFGAVIFTRRDHPSLENLRDLAGHGLMAVSENAFGGFQMAWRELIDAGIDPFEDLRELRFAGFPQDAIVHAVIAAEIDAGTVRSGTLERMDADGLIDIGQIRVLGGRQSEAFPFLHSTRLYPEWPFAKARKTSEKLAQQVAIALLELGPRNQAAAAAYAAGWTIPLDYGPVHELFRELEIGPYAYLGRPSLASVWSEYKGWILFSLAMMIILFVLLVFIGRANRRISQSESRFRQEAQQRRQVQESLARHQQELELRVEERTAELAEVNASLRRSEATLRAIHDITTNADLGFDAKLEGLLQEGCKFFAMEYALVSAATAASGDYRFRTRSSDAGDLDPLAEFSRREMALTRNPLAIADLARYASPDGTAAACNLTGSVLATEYQVDDEVAGFILFGSGGPHREFSDVDIDILQLMAQWLGGETERAEINRRAQRQQAELAHIARLNTMGEMATGIAHELNQPLTAILNYSGGSLRLLQKSESSNADLRAAIEKIGADARRAADIIKRLREFIKRGEHRPERFALRACIEQAVALLQPRLQQESIEVRVGQDADVHEVVADRIQIEQVVVNLLLNAIDALQGVAPSSRRIEVDIDRNGSGEISVAVSDSGNGLPAEVAAHLFDPFFSTKGEGMGMGLSISRSIIEAHGGAIDYRVDDLQRPTFSFTLPDA